MNKNIKNKVLSEEQIYNMIDKWEIEMPEQQFFINLPALVQQAALKPKKPWWSVVFAPMPVTSFIMLFILAFGIVTMQSRISTDKKISLTAAKWASENYGWSNIDEALEVIAGEMPSTQNSTQEKYLSTLQKGIYMNGSDDAAQMLDELSETEMEYLLSELQNTRS